MLRIRHKGIQPNLDMDTTGFTGNVETDAQLAVVTKMEGGRLAALISAAGPNQGKATLADGDPANGLQPLGFIINDAQGYFFENKPALASKQIPIAFGNCVVVTDQIQAASYPIAPGVRLYCGTGADIGLLTTTAPAATAREIGISGSSATVASPELLVYVRG